MLGEQQHVDALQRQLGDARERAGPGEPPERGGRNGDGRTPVRRRACRGAVARRPSRARAQQRQRAPGEHARTAGRARPRRARTRPACRRAARAARRAPPTCSAGRSSRSSMTVGRIARHPRVAASSASDSAATGRNTASRRSWCAYWAWPPRTAMSASRSGAEPHRRRDDDRDDGDRHEPDAQAPPQRRDVADRPQPGREVDQARSACRASRSCRSARTRRSTRRTRRRRPRRGRGRRAT